MTKYNKFVNSAILTMKMTKREEPLAQNIKNQPKKYNHK